MNQPNFDEMDALMGESSGARAKGGDDRVVDVEPVATGPRPRRPKESPRRGAILVAALVGVLTLGVAAVYLAVRGAPSPVVASQDVIAQTLGGNPINPAPQTALPAQPDLTPPLDAASVEAADSGSAFNLEAGAVLALPAVPDAELQAKVDLLQAELEAAKATQAASDKALQEAQNRTPAVVTREANTTFLLVETLIDGAVLRDRAGNEVIVPKGATVQVAGNRLSTGANR